MKRPDASAEMAAAAAAGDMERFEDVFMNGVGIGKPIGFITQEGRDDMPKPGSASTPSMNADAIIAKISEVSEVVGTLVPTVGAIAGIVRLVAAAVRPSDARLAQPFDAAIADFDRQIGGLNEAIAGFDAAKAAAAENRSGNAVASTESEYVPAVVERNAAAAERKPDDIG